DFDWAFELPTMLLPINRPTTRRRTPIINIFGGFLPADLADLLAASDMNFLFFRSVRKQTERATGLRYRGLCSQAVSCRRTADRSCRKAFPAFACPALRWRAFSAYRR